MRWQMARGRKCEDLFLLRREWPHETPIARREATPSISSSPWDRGN